MLRAPSLKVLLVTVSVAIIAHTGSRARADVVTDWNIIALATPPANVAGAPHIRVLGYVHAAIFDAVNAIERRYTPYAVDLHPTPGASAEAAAAAAAHGVLTRMYPLQQPSLDAALAETLRAIDDDPGKDEGLTIGRSVAERIYALSAQDGAAAVVAYQLGKEPWSWRPTAPGMAPRLTQWGAMHPFVVKDLAPFAPPGPLPVQSALYAEEITEVYRLGSATSAERTSDQTAAAIFWTVSPPVAFNEVARALAKRRGNGLGENARLFALLNMAASDSQIITWDAKYHYNLLRPVTAIQEAPLLANAAIPHNQGWRPLIATPGHPDYPSGHCAAAGASVRILQLFFDTDVADVEVTYPPLFGVTRSWKTLSALETEVGEARILGRDPHAHGRQACAPDRPPSRRTHLPELSPAIVLVLEAPMGNLHIGEDASAFSHVPPAAGQQTEAPGQIRSPRPTTDPVPSGSLHSGAGRHMAFDLGRLVVDCRAALATDRPGEHLRELVRRSVSDPAAIVRELGEPTRAKLQPLYRAPDLTIIHLVWAPMMMLMPHDHRMLAAIGIYAGREDNIFWRRVAGAQGGRLEAVGARALGAGDATLLEHDAIHSVMNPIARLTGAIHVYAGDFFGVPRSEWDPETLLEGRFDPEQAVRRFDEANA